MNTHLKVAAAVAAAALAAGCGVAPVNPAAKVARGATAKSAAPAPSIIELVTGEKPKSEKAAVESLWGGSIGSRSASISVMGGWVRASMGSMEFSGNAFGQGVHGSIRLEGGPSESVNLSVFGTGMSGWVGKDSADAHVTGGNWVIGRVGSHHMTATVNRTMISGDMNGKRVFLSGSGVEQGEGAAMIAALLALTAAAR